MLMPPNIPADDDSDEDDDDDDDNAADLIGLMQQK